jgi:hypothetical protein
MMTHAEASTPADMVLESEPVGLGVLVRRIQAEYLEMPGLTLTPSQAARLWNLNARQSEVLLAELVDRQFLMRDQHGAYRRRGCPRCS